MFKHNYHFRSWERVRLFMSLWLKKTKTKQKTLKQKLNKTTGFLEPLSPAVAASSLTVSTLWISHSSTDSSQKPDCLWNFSSLLSIGLLRGNHKLAGHGSACLSASFYLTNRGQLQPDALTSGPASALHQSSTQLIPVWVWDSFKMKQKKKRSFDETGFLLAVNCVSQRLNSNKTVLTCSFVVASRWPVQRSLFLVSVPAMMASVMMVMVVMTFLNRFLQNVVIQIHLLRALWCKSGRAPHGGIGNGLRKKTSGGYINAFGYCYLGILQGML